MVLELAARDVDEEGADLVGDAQRVEPLEVGRVGDRKREVAHLDAVEQLGVDLVGDFLVEVEERDDDLGQVLVVLEILPGGLLDDGRSGDSLVAVAVAHGFVGDSSAGGAAAARSAVGVGARRAGGDVSVATVGGNQLEGVHFTFLRRREGFEI